MKHLSLDRDWVKLLGAVTMAGLILAGCGQADRNASGGITTTTSTSTTTTVPVTQPIATLPARVDGTVPTASLAGLVTAVDQVGQSATAVALADEPSSTDSAHRALVVTSGSLQRYAVLLVELDDDGLDELATLLGDLVEGIDELADEVAAGRSDFAAFVVTLETRIEAVQRAWAARATEWEASWERAGREWQAEWDRAAAEWEAEWNRSAAEWEAEWDRAAAEWEAGWTEAEADWERTTAEWEAGWAEAEADWDETAAEWDAAAAEWDAYWEQVAEDWEQAWEDADSGDQER